MTAREMLEKHGVDCDTLESEAEYSFKNIINAMEEYKATNDTSASLSKAILLLKRVLSDNNNIGAGLENEIREFIKSH